MHSHEKERAELVFPSERLRVHLTLSLLVLASLAVIAPAGAQGSEGHLPVWEVGLRWSYMVDHDVDYQIGEDFEVDHIKENWTRVVDSVVGVGGEDHYKVWESRRGTMTGVVRYQTLQFAVSAQATGLGWTLVRARDMALVDQTFNLTFTAQLPLGLGTLRGGFDNVTTFDPPMPMLEFPIPPTTWNVRSTINTTSELYVSSPFVASDWYNTSELWDINVTATGPASLTVPAGTYEAFAVHEMGTRSNATDTWPVDRKWYYADRALNTVRTFEGHELVWTSAVYVPPNRPPEGPAGPVELTMEEDGTLEIDLAGHFSDPDGDELHFTFHLVGPSASNATLEGVGANFTLRPAADWNGMLQLRASASDPSGQTVNGTFNVEVTPVNDPPHSVGKMPRARVEEDTPEQGVYDLSQYFGDVDGDPLAYSVVVDQGADVVVNGTMLDIFPWQDYVGFIQVQVTAADPSSEIALQVAIVDVGQVNDPPTIVNSGGPARVHEGEEGTFWVEAEDLESETFGYTWYVNGSEVFGHDEPTLVFAPLDEGGSVVNITVVVSDGWNASDTASWDVTVLDSPVIVSTEPMSLTELYAYVGDTIMFSVEVRDADTPDPSIRWTWNGDLVGTGPQLPMRFGAVDVGVGMMFVNVSDGVGTDLESWMVTVSVLDLPPTVSIVAPADGSTFKVGDVLTFRAEVDDEDVASLEVRWSVDGSPVGSGTEVSYQAAREGVLSVEVVVSDGVHDVNATVSVEVEAVDEGDGGDDEASWAGWLVIALVLGALVVMVALVLRRRPGPPD